MGGGIGNIGRNRNTGRVLALAALTLLLTAWTSEASAQTYSFVRSWPSIWGFDSPGGVAVDASGNMYVADTFNHRIQKLAPDGTVLAKWGAEGDGDGQFYRPTDVAVDASGNVYVTDSYYRIQKFSSSGAFLGAFGSPGNGDGQLIGPRGVAVDASGNVYVVDAGNHRIQKFASSGTFLAKWGSAGFADGQFGGPYGVAVDASGNVYVSDYGDRIQKFTSSGGFLAKWGTSGIGDGQFQEPRGVAVDGSGNVYVVDRYNRRIQKFSSSGGFLTKWGASGIGDGQFNFPVGVAVDASGNVYVADTENHRIQKFTSSGGFLAKWGANGTGDGQFTYPGGVAMDASGNVYVGDGRNHRIQKFTSSGAFLTKWGTNGTGDGQFNYPVQVAVDASSNVYVVDSGNHRIQKFTSSGGFLAQWGSSGSGDGLFSYPQGVAVDASGNVYVADTYNHRIQKFTSSGGFLTKWGTSGTGDGQFTNPAGVAVDASGHVYVSDTYNHRIQKFTSSGGFLAKWGNEGFGDGQLSYPWGVAVDTSGNVYVADRENNRIQKFSSTGAFLAGWGAYGTGDGQFRSPSGVGVDGSGNVYVADNGNHRIQQFSPSPPTVTAIDPAGPNPTNALLVNFTVTFSQPVTGVDIDDFVLTTSGVAGASIASVSADSGDTRTVTVGTGAGTGTLRLDLVDNDSLVDSNASPLGGTGAGNGDFNTGTAYTVDKDGPAVTLSSASAATVNAAITVAVTLDEASTDFDASDIVPTNASVSGFAGSGTSYGFTLTPSLQGAFSATVDAGACTDALGNLSTAGNVLSRSYDSVGPVPTFGSTAPDPTNVSPIPVTVVFTEAVTGFDATDVVAGNATLGDFAGSGTSFTFTLTPAGPGTVTADIAGGACTDAVGNASSAAVQFTRTFDDAVPTVTLSSTALDPTGISPIPVTVTFSKAVTGFTAADIAVTNATVNNFTGSGAEYAFDLVPAGVGQVTVNVAAGVCQDTAGNPNTAATALTRTYNNVSPTVSLTSTVTGPTNTSPIPVTAVFSAAVTGFEAGDLVLTNGMIANFHAESATTYTFELTPSGEGTVTASVPAGVATAGVGNQPGSFSLVYDTTPPVITLLGSASVEVLAGNPYFDAGATALDAVDGDISASIVVDTSAVDVYTPGTYSVTFDVTDAAGNPAVQVVRTVTVMGVIDGMPLLAWPVLLALLGAALYALRARRRTLK